MNNLEILHKAKKISWYLLVTEINLSLCDKVRDLGICSSGMKYNCAYGTELKRRVHSLVNLNLEDEKIYSLLYFTPICPLA